MTLDEAHFSKVPILLILIFETTYYFGSGLSDWFWKVCADSVFYQKLIIFLFSHFFSFRKLDQRCWTMREKKYLEIEDTSVFYTFYYINFEITGDPCNPIGSHQCNLFMNHTIFCSKLHLFPSHWKTLSKTQQPIRCQGLFMVTNQIRGLRKKDNFCNF